MENLANMSKILVIGDIHQHHQTAELYLKKWDGPVIFMGDYFDQFYDNPEHSIATAEWLKETSGLRYYIKRVVNTSKKTKNRRFIILAKGDNESEYPEKISFFRSYGFSKADIIKIPK